jgi:ribonuclease P protein component
MLPKQYRLKHTKDFDILFKEGRFVGGALITVKVWRVEPQKYPTRNYTTKDLKIGFVVGKKVHKSAVKRNMIKRRMREVVRLLLKENRLKDGFMVAIVAKPLILAKKYEEIQKDIEGVLQKSRLLV